MVVAIHTQAVVADVAVPTESAFAGSERMPGSRMRPPGTLRPDSAAMAAACGDPAVRLALEVVEDCRTGTYTR